MGNLQKNKVKMGRVEMRVFVSLVDLLLGSGVFEWDDQVQFGDILPIIFVYRPISPFWVIWESKSNPPQHWGGF
jgi:hypothetical protein